MFAGGWVSSDTGKNRSVDVVERNREKWPKRLTDWVPTVRHGRERTEAQC